MSDLMELIKGGLDFVNKKKYKILVYEPEPDLVLYEDFEWSISELTMFLMKNKIKEIHLYKEEE